MKERMKGYYINPRPVSFLIISPLFIILVRWVKYYQLTYEKNKKNN